jgi:hypothetical protein
MSKNPEPSTTESGAQPPPPGKPTSDRRITRVNRGWARSSSDRRVKRVSRGWARSFSDRRIKRVSH